MTMTISRDVRSGDPERNDAEAAAFVAETVHAHLSDYPDKHLQKVWEADTECGTVACIAGWIGILHDDDHSKLDDETTSRSILAQWKWEARQAARLGIDTLAASLFFGCDSEIVAMDMLKGIAEWHRGNPKRTIPMTYGEMDAIREKSVLGCGAVQKVLLTHE